MSIYASLLYSPSVSSCYWLLNYYNALLNFADFQQEWIFTQSAVDGSDNLVNVGLYYTATGGYNALLTKTAPNGELIWSKTILPPTGFNLRGDAVAIDSSNNIYITVIKDNNNYSSRVIEGIIMKLDSTGTILWQKNYDLGLIPNSTTDYELSRILLDSSENLYVGFCMYSGLGGITQSGLLKLNSSGVLQWQRMLASPPNNRTILYNLGIGPDNCPVITYSFQTTSQVYNPSVVKFDSLGNMLWQLEISFPSSLVYLTESYCYVDSNNDIYLALYYNYIIKISSTGTKLLEKSFSGVGYGFNFTTITGDAAGNIYMATEAYTVFYLFKFDSAMNILWQNQLSFSDSNYNISPGLYSGYDSNIFRLRNNTLYLTGVLSIDNFNFGGNVYVGMVGKFPTDTSANGTYPFVSLTGTFTYDTSSDWVMTTSNDLVLLPSSRPYTNSGGTISVSTLTTNSFTAYNYPSPLLCSAIAPPGPAFPEPIVLLSHFDGTNGSTQFIDCSIPPKVMTQSGPGGALSTEQVKFGTASYKRSAGAAQGEITVSNMGQYTSYSTSFTFECWFYLAGGPGPWGMNMFIGYQNGFSNRGISIGVGREYSPENYWWIVRVNGQGITLGMLQFNTAALQNAWHFLAFSYDGVTNTGKLFIDGNAIYTFTIVPTADLPQGNTATLYSTYDASSNWYFDETRITVGLARYSANFTPPTQPFICPSTGGSDPDYYDVDLLMHFEGADGDSIFVDSSPYPKTFTLSLSPPITSTTQVKWGVSSGYFNGNNWFTLTTPLVLSGNYTIEGWAYTAQSFFQVDINGGSITMIGHSGSGAFLGSSVSLNSNSYINVSGTPVNTWYHWAVVQSGNVMTVYINGIASGTGNTFGGIGFQLGLIGRYTYSSGQYNYTGYLDDLRITGGVARYTANFPVPTAAFPNS